MSAYRRALALRPQYAEALFNLGNAAREAGRADEALAHYDKALQLQPDFAEALAHRGTALRNLGRFEEALDLRRGATSSPLSTEALL